MARAEAKRRLAEYTLGRRLLIVRYPRDYRDDPQAIARNVLVNTPDSASIPVGQVASVSISPGAPSIRTENAQLVSYICVQADGAFSAIPPAIFARLTITFRLAGVASLIDYSAETKETLLQER